MVDTFLPIDNILFVQWIRVPQRSRTKKEREERKRFIIYICLYIGLLYMYMERGLEEIYFKDLAPVIVRTGKSEICRADQQAGNSGQS